MQSKLMDLVIEFGDACIAVGSNAIGTQGHDAACDKAVRIREEIKAILQEPTAGEVGTKSLYEVRDSFMGESYCRCYVWADDEKEAIAMAMNARENRGEGRRFEGRKLFSADSPSFVTRWSDEGWDADRPRPEHLTTIAISL